MAPIVSSSRPRHSNPGELVLELLQSCLSGLEMRRRWLQVLCEQFSATHALVDNMSWNPSKEAMVFHDICFWSSDPNWLALEPIANGYSLADSEFETEHFGELMKSTLAMEEGQPPPIVELLWKPFHLGSGITLSAFRTGFYSGAVTIFRDKAAPKQFVGNELHEQPEWETATIDLLTLTYPMLGQGGQACGTFLFGEHGEFWMDNAVPSVGDAQSDSIQRIVKDFIASNATNSVQSLALHSVHLSWLHGQQRRVVLAVSQPLLPTKFTDVLKLSVSERRVAKMAAKGMKIDEIARELDRTTSTVKSHLENIYSILGLECRAELARFYNGVWQYTP